MNLTSGNQNVAVGGLTNVTTGSYNTAIGSGAGNGAKGDFNVFVGHSAGYNETGSSTNYILLLVVLIAVMVKSLYGDFSTGQLDLVKPQELLLLLMISMLMAMLPLWYSYCNWCFHFNWSCISRKYFRCNRSNNFIKYMAVTGAATFSDDATISGALALGDLTDVESSINTNSTNISSNDTDIATINTSLGQFSSGARVFEDANNYNIRLGTDLRLQT